MVDDIRIGIGLPTTLEVDGPDVAAWARRAEERGFAVLGGVDRTVYPNYDLLTSLAVAAGATSRIRLVTDILVAPLYPAVWLAKATASLNAISGGRFTLGVGVGGRPDDFEVMERPFAERGKAMDALLDLLVRAWTGDDLGQAFPVVPGPATRSRPGLLVGGNVPAAIERAVKYADGWTAGGSGPQGAGETGAKVRAAWAAAGREGSPEITALGYFGFGDDDATTAALKRYYGFLGPMADTVAANALRTPDAAKAAVRAFADAGITEIVLNPTVGSLDQVDRLADAVL